MSLRDCRCSSDYLDVYRAVLRYQAGAGRKQNRRLNFWALEISCSETCVACGMFRHLFATEVFRITVIELHLYEHLYPSDKNI